MNGIHERLKEERAEHERRISDYRALVALFCAATHEESKAVERLVRILVALAAVASVAWIAWKTGAIS